RLRPFERGSRWRLPAGMRGKNLPYRELERRWVLRIVSEVRQSARREEGGRHVFREQHEDGLAHALAIPNLVEDEVRGRRRSGDSDDEISSLQALAKYVRQETRQLELVGANRLDA